MRTFHSLADMTGRVALVAGGAGHIGAAICDVLEEMGATVVAADRAPARGARASLVVDLRDEAATRALVPAVLEAHGRLDVLVHSAAYTGQTSMPGWSAPFAEQSVGAWDEAFRVNLTSAFVLAQAASAPLAASGSGAIVLISSIYGVVGPEFDLYAGTTMHNPVAYGASKGGLLQLTRYLSTALAPSVRVNAISPGGIARGQAASFVEKYNARVPLGRMGAEEDVKGAVAYLASDLSRYVTGVNLLVDGGWTAK